MNEDQLTRDERIRLEALNQAVARAMGALGISDVEIVRRARVFERWIREGAQP